MRRGTGGEVREYSVCCWVCFYCSGCGRPLVRVVVGSVGCVCGMLYVFEGGEMEWSGWHVDREGE